MYKRQVYESNDKLDYIGKLWDETEEKPFCLFGFDGENLQHHVFMIGHDSLFDISQGGEVEAVLYTVDGHTVSEGILRLLISSGKFYYSTEEGYEPFAQYRVEEGKLIFVKANGQVPWCEKEIDGIHQDVYKRQLPNKYNAFGFFFYRKARRCV